MTKFKPCPFCGGTNFRITKRGSYERAMRERGRAYITIYCKDCYAEMVKYNFEPLEERSYEAMLSALAKKWNTRVESYANVRYWQPLPELPDENEEV